MTKATSIQTGAASATRRAGTDGSRTGRRRAGSPTHTDGNLPQDAAKTWIRDHQDAAMLAAFAIGVFMGAWMRG